MSRVCRAVALLAVVLPAAPCRAPSEADRVRSFLKETVALAEKRDLAGVMSRLAEDYVDFEGRDRAATERLVRDHFRRTGIVIHLLSARVEGPDADGRASAEAEILMSSGAGEVFRKLVRIAGECFRFEVRLARAPGQGWRIVWARWESVPFTELFPESLAILKKLFPDF